MKQTQSIQNLLETEVWRQDHSDANLWHGAHGLMVNTDALADREVYFNIIRLSQSHLPKDSSFHQAA